MAESRTQQGKRWVRITVGGISRQNRIPVKRILGWRVGDHVERLVPEDQNRDDSVYYLPIELQTSGEIKYIKFSRRQLDDCANPTNTSRRTEVERYIRQQLDSLVA